MKVSLLLDDCKHYGTLAFAHLARAGFVAVSLLNSLVARNHISSEERDRFMASLSTVTSEFSRDGQRVFSEEYSWEAYIEKYGHLRPGTYDITSTSYKENPNQYLRPFVCSVEETESPCFEWSTQSKMAIQTALNESGLSMSIKTFDAFLREAIVGREFAKFEFTRHIDASLTLIANWAEQMGLSREDCAHLPISEFLSVAKGGENFQDLQAINHKLSSYKEQHRINQVLELPSLVRNSDDIFCFEYPISEPNYVTSKQILSDIVILNNAVMKETNIENKIICIQQADPGFDWIFGHNISGLITMYGGANSHMSIRSAEFGIPAAIGVGETVFNQLNQASVVELNCMDKMIRVIQ